MSPGESWLARLVCGGGREKEEGEEEGGGGKEREREELGGGGKEEGEKSRKDKAK